MRFSTHDHLISATSVALMLALIGSSTGCYTMQNTAVAATEPPSPHFAEPVYGVTTTSGEEVTFDEAGEVRIRGVAVADSQVRRSSDADIAIVHGAVDGAPHEIPLRDVAALKLKRPQFNKGLTWGIVGGVAGFFATMFIVMAAVYANS